MAASTSRAELLRELAGAFKAAGRKVDADTDAILRDHDLTAPLGELIWVLDPAGEAPPMKHLAVTLRCDRSNVTGLVEKLVQRGLAERHEDPYDRRSKAVRLTAQGIKVRTSILRQLIEGSAFTALDNSDLGRLLKLLGRMAG